MARKTKLTWQAGNPGRWKKIYRGKSYYFSSGRGKSDRDAYAAAVSAWEELKLELDSNSPIRQDYQHEIDRWEAVQQWCESHPAETLAHSQQTMGELAAAKLVSLRRGLDDPKPRPVAQEDKFASQFELRVRAPERVNALAQIGEVFGTPAPTTTPLVDPVPQRHADDPLEIERIQWLDRLSSESTQAEAVSDRLDSNIQSFIRWKRSLSEAGEITLARVASLSNHLSYFQKWAGASRKIDESPTLLTEFHAHLVDCIGKRTCSDITAKERIVTAKSFVRWLWETERIAELPRALVNRSRSLSISTTPPVVVDCTLKEVTELLTHSSDRTKLYLLLMLNCAMTQKDIADLKKSEVDLKLGYLTRKRSKTRKHANVPVVRYALWPETRRLLAAHMNKAKGELALVNANGGPLWQFNEKPDGGTSKIDNIKSAFNRLRKQIGFSKPLKALKKTSASLLRQQRDYSGLEDLFLGHAPRLMSDRHYAKEPQELLDEAIMWLGQQYGIVPSE